MKMRTQERGKEEKLEMRDKLDRKRSCILLGG
jgi:hypothetical protein